MCPTAEDMWDQLKTHFGQTSETQLHTLQLKWMQYKMESNRTMAEHLRIMSAMICDLNATGKDVFEEEQVLNVIWAIRDESEH